MPPPLLSEFNVVE